MPYYKIWARENMNNFLKLQWDNERGRKWQLESLDSDGDELSELEDHNHLMEAGGEWAFAMYDVR